jgi:hypothetical protein
LSANRVNYVDDKEIGRGEPHRKKQPVKNAPLFPMITVTSSTRPTLDMRQVHAQDLYPFAAATSVVFCPFTGLVWRSSAQAVVHMEFAAPLDRLAFGHGELLTAFPTLSHDLEAPSFLGEQQ